MIDIWREFQILEPWSSIVNCLRLGSIGYSCCGKEEFFLGPWQNDHMYTN